MNIYSARAEERRKQFNHIINGCDMVLINNIAEIDPSIWDNWTDKTPMGEECDITDGHCTVHDRPVDLDAVEYCDEYEQDGAEVFQWFAVNPGDAEFLQRHNQYITYSDELDTYFMAITHFGTSWDYTSMVDDFEDCYHGLDELDDEKEVV